MSAQFPMVHGLEPTETTDKQITVLSLSDDGRRQRRGCSSFEDAISLVKRLSSEDDVTKIENRDEEIVFTSDEMNIETWAHEWRNAKRRLSVDVEAHGCPYENGNCLPGDLCVQCEMDTVQHGY